MKLYQNQSIKFIDLFSYHIKSKACRNAVKFNDELEREFINELMQSLSLCNNPFLCAHGRHNFYLLKEHISPPFDKTERINYKDFKIVAEKAKDFSEYFKASTFLKFDKDKYGRIEIIAFFHYLVRKNNI